jgi:hypothetical protein
VPANVTLVPLPPYSPELNPVERIWLYLRERFLSLRVFKDDRAIVNACCAAWNRLVAEPDRIAPCVTSPGSQRSFHKLVGINGRDRNSKNFRKLRFVYDSAHAFLECIANLF